MTTVVKNGWETVENIEEVRADIKVCTDLLFGNSYFYWVWGSL